MPQSTYRATEQEVALLLQIIEKLNRCTDSRLLRQSIADDVLRLIRADMLGSFVWNEHLQQFEDAAYVNMTPDNLQRYEDYFQWRDPITPLLQLRTQATLVTEVMDQRELEKTEFFNDFLKLDGLKWGINLYAYDGNMNIGDLRIWRGVGREPFGIREVQLLETLKPHFTNAMINSRNLTELRSRVSGWHDLWEHHPNPSLIFDQFGKGVHENSAARQLKIDLLPLEWNSLHAQIINLLRGNFQDSYWRNYRLSFIKTSHEEGDKSLLYMVQITSKSKLVINQEFILKNFNLTFAEAKICLWIMRGLSDQVIAEQTHRSIWTVRAHMKSIFQKLEVYGRSELTHLITSKVADIETA